MTTIIAVETEDGVTFGFDAKTSSGYHNYEGDRKKVFANNGMVFGVAGSVLDAELIQYADLPDPADAGWDIDRWVVTKLVPATVAALTERNAASFENHKIDTESIYLVAVRGRVYQVSQNTCMIRRKDGVYTIGSGSDYARGALAAGATIKKALRIAAENDMASGRTLRIATEAEVLTPGWGLSL